MAAAVKFHQFCEDLGKGVHNLDTGSLKILLSNASPDAAADAIKTDLTSELATANGYTAGGAALASVDFEQVAGVGTLSASDLVFTASGGPIGPFRYAVLWNDTPVAPLDPLICYWDYGSSITLLDGENFTVDFTTSTLTVG